MFTIKPNQTKYVIELLSDGEIWTCDECPFCALRSEKQFYCSVDLPLNAYVTLDRKPNWCPLKKVE